MCVQQMSCRGSEQGEEENGESARRLKEMKKKDGCSSRYSQLESTCWRTETTAHGTEGEEREDGRAREIDRSLKKQNYLHWDFKMITVTEIQTTYANWETVKINKRYWKIYG